MGPTLKGTPYSTLMMHLSNGLPHSLRSRPKPGLPNPGLPPLEPLQQPLSEDILRDQGL